MQRALLFFLFKSSLGNESFDCLFFYASFHCAESYFWSFLRVYK